MAQIDAIFEQKWSKEAHIAFTQTESKLKDAARVVNDPARTYNWNKFTQQSANENPSRHQPLTITAADATTVPATVTSIYSRHAIDDLDKAQTSFDYRNDLSKMAAIAVWQKFDDKFIAALEASSAATITLPTANVFNYNGALETMNALDLNDVPTMGRFALLSPGAFKDILADTTAVNSFNYANNAVKTGQLEGIAGFDRMIKSTRLAVPSAGQRTCWFWKKEAFGIHYSSEFNIKVERSVETNGWYFTATVQASFAVIDVTGVVKAAVTD
ncbi:phage capsid protein [Dongia sp.]|uniref:phage capsid protein n=1 Tax=Dongia sp. TaxID=1977262 RepID=UPI0035AD7705